MRNPVSATMPTPPSAAGPKAVPDNGFRLARPNGDASSVPVRQPRPSDVALLVNAAVVAPARAGLTCVSVAAVRTVAGLSAALLLTGCTAPVERTGGESPSEGPVSSGASGGSGV